MEIDDSVLPTDDSGDNVSGTKTNRSFFAKFKAAINAIIHSTTNPTVYVKNVIDEVVAARDGYTTLLAKIRSIANTFKIYSQYATVGNVGGGTDTLQSITITESLNVGDAIHVRGWGKCANTANNKVIQLIVEGVVALQVPNAGSLQDMYWGVDAIVLKTGATSWTSRATLLGNVLNTAGIVLGYETAAGATALNACTISFTGSSAGSATDDVVQHGMTVKVERA